MGGDSGAQTSATLLGRLRHDPRDQAAWGQFVERYGPQIYGWCRRWGLQDADAQDVSQDVLARLAEKIRGFAYDPAGSFRGWLKTLAYHALSDFLAARNRPGGGSGDSQVAAALALVEAREDLAKRLDAAWDRELLNLAMRRVQLRVKPHTWAAFRLTALEGLSGAEAAARLQMKVANVFVAKSDVQKMIRAEIAELEGPDAD